MYSSRGPTDTNHLPGDFCAGPGGVSYKCQEVRLVEMGFSRDFNIFELN